jgi:hypothetical protein
MESCDEISISLNAFKSIVSGIKDQIIKEFENSFELLKRRVIFVEQSVDIIKRNLSSYERERIRKNVIIKGLIENETETENLELRVICFLKEKLGVQLNKEDIDVVFRIGKSKAGIKSRHVILKLTNQRKKSEIMTNKWKLKNTKFYIDNDLPKEVLEKQFLSRQEKRASLKNKNFDTKVNGRLNRNHEKTHSKSKHKKPKSKSFKKKLDSTSWTLSNTHWQSQ